MNTKQVDGNDADLLDGIALQRIRRLLMKKMKQKDKVDADKVDAHNLAAAMELLIESSEFLTKAYKAGAKNEKDHKS